MIDYCEEFGARVIAASVTDKLVQIFVDLVTVQVATL